MNTQQHRTHFALSSCPRIATTVLAFAICASSSRAQSLFRGENPPREPSTQPAARPAEDTKQPATKPATQPANQPAGQPTTQPAAPQSSQPAQPPTPNTTPQPAPPAPAPRSPLPAPSSPLKPGAADRAQLAGYSLIALEPAEPREVKVHDTIFIIINETSKQSSTSKLDTKTSVNNQGRLNAVPDLAALLELQLQNGNSNPLLTAGMSGNENWKGDGKYERSDRFTDRIAATVIDVRPNGTLVVEARRTIGKDDEVQTVLVSGIARREDITNANTVLSSQLADLTIMSETSGELREATQKGWITRVFEAVFNF